MEEREKKIAEPLPDRQPEPDRAAALKAERQRRVKRLMCRLGVGAAVLAGLLLGVTVFHDRAYLWISLWIALVSCLPFFLAFERKQNSTGHIVILAVLTILSVMGRFAFAAVPHFKPVAAIVVITGMYLGPESGFLCGAFSALLSNILFGQGPWTPFQMFAWGIIGFLAGLASGILRRSRVALGIGGALAGVLFSLLMDVWTALFLDGTLKLSRYFAAVAMAAPVTLVYAGSNVLFLLLLAGPIGKKLQRVMQKYGIT